MTKATQNLLFAKSNSYNSEMVIRLCTHKALSKFKLDFQNAKLGSITWEILKIKLINKFKVKQTMRTIA